MRRLVLAVAAFIPLWSAAQAPAEPAPAGTQAGSGPRPVAIEPAPPPSSSPPRTPRSYLFAKLGALVPRATDMDGFANGVAVEAGAGTRLTRYLAVEVGSGYLRTSQDETGSNSSVGSYHMTQDLSAVPIVATVRLSGRAREFELYALGGAGLYLWSLGSDVSSSQYAPYSFSGKDTGFGVHLGAGLSASLSRRFVLGLEAKVLVAQATFLDRTSNVDSAIVTVSVGYGL